MKKLITKPRIIKNFGLRFEKIGLPKGHAYPELAFHPPTGFVIVHTRPLESPLPCRRVSLKRVNESCYRPIADFPSSISVENFLVHSRLPLLYFTTWVWSKYPNGPPGGDWDALYCFNLETGKSKIIVQKDGLVLPNGYQRAWLNALLSASADGKTLFCRAAFVRNIKGGHYCISKLSVADRKITIIEKLKTSFA